MSLLNNVLGGLGISQGNIIRNAMKFVGLPEGLAAGVGLVMDLKNGNLGSALFKTGPALLQALTGGQAGQANSVEKPSSFLGTIAKVAGFAALGGGALLAAPALLGSLGSVGGALGNMLKGNLGIAGALGFGALALGAGGGGGLFTMLGGSQSQDLRKSLGMTRTQGSTDSMLSRLPNPAAFEDIVAAFMMDFVKDKQKEIEGKLDKLRQSAANAEGNAAKGGIQGFLSGAVSSIPLVGGLLGRLTGAGNDTKGGSSESRNLEFEQLKNEMQKLSQMQQAMSNVLNEMHNLAMSSIRSIKG